ncbi:hypothetical protein Pmani_014450 [Petrolisthes manimaculis]|uniref:Uncharacterized protein n=1 Tax=Petrolisthes manimaculis TaxID=1843537 RepID=A0AAE1UD59_9EUCA|nr:hypothetical protein Pmani_014450 [Petrolisthes manimaculis]
MVHVPGVCHVAADAVFHRPPSELKSGTAKICDVSTTSAAEMIKSVTWDDVRQATSSDPSMTQLLDIIADGFPDSHKDLLPDLGPYHRFRDGLPSFDSVALYNDCVTIRQSLRYRVIQALHSPHQGVSQMCSRLLSSFFWYSNWPIVDEAAGGSSRQITALHHIFVTYGISDELTSDGSPEFQSHKTKNFLHDWGMNHRTSSVAFLHSNCRAVVGVKILKHLITDNIDTEGKLDNNKFQHAMLQYCNTPDQETHLSPAMCIFG